MRYGSKEASGSPRIRTPCFCQADSHTMCGFCRIQLLSEEEIEADDGAYNVTLFSNSDDVNQAWMDQNVLPVILNSKTGKVVGVVMFVHSTGHDQNQSETLSEINTVRQELFLKERECNLANEKMDTMAEQLVKLQADLEKAREQLVEHGCLLDQIRMEKEMLETSLELEIETYEALLQKERNKAQRIVDKIRLQGCKMDVEGGLHSEYAAKALEGAFGECEGECRMTVTYEGNLDNPVGAIVYAHDEQQDCTKVLAAFAAPNRGVSAANFEAVKEYARRQGDDTLVLDSVENAVPFWQRLGFVSEVVQKNIDSVRMYTSLGS